MLVSAHVEGFTVLAVTVASLEAFLRVLGSSSDDPKRIVIRQWLHSENRQ